MPHTQCKCTSGGVALLLVALAKVAGGVAEAIASASSEPLGAPKHFRRKGNDFVLVDDAGNSKVIHLHAGEMHYFRIPEIYWEDRLIRLRAMGLNAVSTYVPWNWHEQKEGYFDFEGDRKNVAKFFQLARKHGLLAIIRPGPYICAEWENGGLPAWLLPQTSAFAELAERPGPAGPIRGFSDLASRADGRAGAAAHYGRGGELMQLRTGNEQFMRSAGQWLSRLYGHVRPQLLENGGAIVAVQLENEYGYWGDAKTETDRRYLVHLSFLVRHYLSADVFIFSTDSPDNVASGRGSTPGVFSAVNLGPWHDPEAHLAQALGQARTFNNGGPDFVQELWTGWFLQWDAFEWGKQRFEQPTSTLVDYVGMLLARNASFTLYMADGGTNFGLWASATALRTLGPGNGTVVTGSFVTSSYDYAAPISEDGRHGHDGHGVDKYQALRTLMLSSLSNATRHMVPEEPPPPRLASYGQVAMDEQVSLRDPGVLNLLCNNGWSSGSKPTPALPMEFHMQEQGLILYRYNLQQKTSPPSFLRIRKPSAQQQEGEPAVRELELKAKDRVSVWQNDDLLVNLQLNTNYTIPEGNLTSVKAKIRREEGEKSLGLLDVLVENLGRRAYNHDIVRRLASPYAHDFKGLLQATLDGAQLVGHWKVCSIPFEDLSEFDGQSLRSLQKKPWRPGPTFFRGSVSVDDEPSDTFLLLGDGDWSTGYAFVNGFTLGRYHREAQGPFDFYVPKNLLRKGQNDVVLLEMDAANAIKGSRGPRVRLEASRAAIQR